jgi:hypothetical protein
MKKFLIFLLLLAGIAWPVVAQSRDSTDYTVDSTRIDSKLIRINRSPLTNQSLLVGNVYFVQPNAGNGTTRWAEGRFLFGRFKDYRLFSGGIFINGVEVGSKIANYLYYGTEITFGPAINFGSQKFSKKHELWGWINAGLKLSSDQGQINQYNSKQKDKSIYLFGGILFKNSLGRGPFFIDKIMVTYQRSLESTRESYWGETRLSDPPTNKGYLKLIGENTFVSLPLNKFGSLRFEPKIIAGVAYEFEGRKTFYTAGVGLTLARRYSQEIVTLQLDAKFNQNFPETIYSAGIMVNLVELGKVLFKKQF